MAEEGIYVSLSVEEQRKYRSELLLAQTEVLSLMKKMQTVKEIRGEKAEYRLKLAREFATVLEGLKRFHEKMPNPKIPKNFLDKSPVVEKTYVVPEVESEMDEDALERELREIQEQLKMITG